MSELDYLSGEFTDEDLHAQAQKENIAKRRPMVCWILLFAERLYKKGRRFDYFLLQDAGSW